MRTLSGLTVSWLSRIPTCTCRTWRATSRLGQLDRLQNRMDEARQHYEEALRSYRQLAQQNPDAYLLDMATALNNLGTVDGIQNRMDDARQHFEEALKIYRQPGAAESRCTHARLGDDAD